MTSYLGLDDFIETAAELLGLPEETVVKMARLDLAESALHAPQAGWGEVEFYPEFTMNAAVPMVRRPSSACGPSPPRPQRTWKWSRPRSPAGSPLGCIHSRERLTDRSDEGKMSPVGKGQAWGCGPRRSCSNGCGAGG